MANEKRLIRADPMLEKIRDTAEGLADCDQQNAAWALRKYAVRDIMDAETVDAVEVVRCRDCTYWGDEDGKLHGSDGVLFARCKAHNYLIDGRHTGWCPSENDFCSYGERKDCDD